MKLTSSALLIAPLLVFISSTVAAPHPEPIAASGDAGVKSKITQLLEVRDSANLLEARAPVTGTVNANGVRYRRCASTSCEVVGQYNANQVIDINCRTRGESVNGWNWWDRMSNGFYISDYYVNWTGGIPDECIIVE